MLFLHALPGQNGTASHESKKVATQMNADKQGRTQIEHAARSICVHPCLSAFICVATFLLSQIIPLSLI